MGLGIDRNSLLFFSPATLAAFCLVGIGVYVDTGCAGTTSAAGGTRLVQVLRNLLCNAIEYLRARTEASGEAAAHLFRAQLRPGDDQTSFA